MPFADVRDLRVYYEKRGSGPRLLYISGTGGDLRRAPRVFDRPIAARFEILAPMGEGGIFLSVYSITR